MTAGPVSLFQAGFEQPGPVVSFDSDSITITFDPAGSGIFEIENGGTAVFTINAAAPAPAPAALSLLGLGLAGLAFARRR